MFDATNFNFTTRVLEAHLGKMGVEARVTQHTNGPNETTATATAALDC